MASKNPALQVGTIHTSKNYGQFEIIEYRSFADIIIRFLDTGYVTSARGHNIVNGKVRDAKKTNVHTLANYVLRSPEGVLVRPTNVNWFCKYIGLSRYDIAGLVKGRRRNVDGWTLA